MNSENATFNLIFHKIIEGLRNFMLSVHLIRREGGSGGWSLCNADRSITCFQNFPRPPCAHAERLARTTLRAYFIQIKKISHYYQYNEIKTILLSGYVG